MRSSILGRSFLLRSLPALLLLLAAPVFASQVPVVEETDPESQTEDPGVTPPQIILVTQKAPVYPPAALAGRFGGSVKVKVWVDDKGKVSKAEPIECDHPNLGFEEASVAAVKQWRFEPAVKEGLPVEYVTTIRLNFRTEGTGANRKAYVSAGVATASDTRTDTAVERQVRRDVRPAPVTSGRKP